MNDAERIRLFGEELRFWVTDHFPEYLTDPIAAGFADTINDLLVYIGERCAEFDPSTFGDEL